MSKQFDGTNLNKQKFNKNANRQDNSKVWHNPVITRMELKRTLFDAAGPYNDGNSFTSVFPVD